jgi:hypothetical protein
MPLYIVTWRDRDDGTLFDGEWKEPSLTRADIQALSELPEGTEIVSVQEAGYARESEDEQLA